MIQKYLKKKTQNNKNRKIASELKIRKNTLKKILLSSSLLSIEMPKLRKANLKRNLTK